MATYGFRIVNVFAESTLGGNPLCVFEDGEGLSAETMQALALQFNLSETTFLLPSAAATARLRIFTPSFEMPFAGHPTLGSAHVARALGRAGDALTFEMHAGIIPVTARGHVWTLEARPPQSRPAEATRGELAAMLGLAEVDVAGGARWIDTGSEQLVVPLTSAQAVARCDPDPRLLARHGSNARRTGLAYVWAGEGEGAAVARFFFLKHGAIVEDPGTGSACANLGGWLLASGRSGPFELSIRQGEATGRPCRLGLRVDGEGRILVSGRVIALGSGQIEL